MARVVEHFGRVTFSFQLRIKEEEEEEEEEEEQQQQQQKAVTFYTAQNLSCSSSLSPSLCFALCFVILLVQ
jgi:hypothetical protein